MAETVPLYDRAQRFPIMAPLHFRPAGMPHWRDGRTVNMSCTGILFEAEETIPENSVLDIRVDLPMKVVLECHCSVVRTGNSRIAVHIRRHNLSHH